MTEKILHVLSIFCLAFFCSSVRYFASPFLTSFFFSYFSNLFLRFIVPGCNFILIPCSHHLSLGHCSGFFFLLISEPYFSKWFWTFENILLLLYTSNSIGLSCYKLQPAEMANLFSGPSRSWGKNKKEAEEGRVASHRTTTLLGIRKVCDYFFARMAMRSHICATGYT